MYILFSFFGYLSLAVVALLDKFIVSDKKIAPLVVAFYSTAPALPILLLIPFGVQPIHAVADWFIAFVAGGSFTLALWTMYLGFEHSEVSHGGPLVGAAIPFFTLSLGFLLIHERITTVQLVATCLLIVGSLVISYEQTQKVKGWNKHMGWLILAGLFFALSNIASKYLYDRYGFYSGFIWSRAGLALSGVILLAFGAVRQSLLSVNSKEVKAQKSKILAVVADKGLGFLGALLVQYAIAIGSVTIVNALSGLQYALLIILVALFTRFLPKYFKEDYAKGEFVQEGLAVVVIAIGVALLLV